MKSISIAALMFASKICFSYCQPAVSTYNFVATMNGVMKKELTCQQKIIIIKSYMLVDLWVYQVTYDETAIGEKNVVSGIKSSQYKVVDSRKDKVINLQIEKSDVDFQSLPYVLGYQLAKQLPFSKKMNVISEEGEFVYEFHILSKNEKIKTPLGILETVKIQGKDQSGDQLTYWLWKRNYSVVKEEVVRNNTSVLDATIVTQSADVGCCWA